MSNKKRLVERFTLSPHSYTKKDNLSESDQVVVAFDEGKGSKKEYKAKAVYTFPISKPDEKNLNERIYSTKLWENVIKSKTGEGSYGLIGHPTDEGSPKDRWCVWRNLRFSEDKKTILADAYLFGHWGKEVLEGLEAGGKVGLSTSGFGEMNEDGVYVNPETFELERVADFVFNPSYEVFGEMDDRVDVPEDKTESVDSDTVTISEDEMKKNSNYLVEENNKEKKTMEKDKLNTSEEKVFKLNMNSLFREAKKIENLNERIKEYNELLSYFDEGMLEDLQQEIKGKLSEDVALKEELAQKGENVDKLIEENTSELNEKVTSLEEKVSTLENEKKEFEEKYKNSVNLLDSLKVYTNKLREMYDVTKAEGNGKITATEYKEALAYIDQVEEEKKELQGKVREYWNKLKRQEKLSRSRPSKSVQKKPVFDAPKVEENSDNHEDEEVVNISEEYPNTPQSIVEYYEDLEISVPEVVKIKKDILNCKTLVEAQNTYIRLKGLLYENPEYTRRSREQENFKKEKNNSTRLPKGWV